MFLTIAPRSLVKLLTVCILSISAISCSHKAVIQTPADTTISNKLVYVNPVFNHDFPDPNLVEAKDGFFYAYSTQASWKNENFGGSYFLPIIRSKNLINWEVVGDALKKKPDWKSEGGIWAPDATFYNNSYFLYYSY